MKLTVVGCSGSYPGPDSPASCYLLEADDSNGRTWRVLLDLGSGALGPLHRYVDPLRIDAVVLSHLHPDHCMDFCGYYVLRKYHPEGAPPRIPVWGPAATPERLARAYDLPLDPGMREEFDFRTYDGTFEIGAFSIEPILVDHPVDAFGLRISAGGSTLGYSGDTAMCAGVAAVARDTDAFLAEASFRDADDNPGGVHLTGVDCGDLAADHGVKRLLLTHIPPWHDREAMRQEAAGVFSGRIDVVSAGDVYEV